METQLKEEFQINLEEVKNGFVASGYSLFDFILNYNFITELSFDEKITIYCQLVSQYDSIFNISSDFDVSNNFEIAIVYPK